MHLPRLRGFWVTHNSTKKPTAWGDPIIDFHPPVEPDYNPVDPGSWPQGLIQSEQENLRRQR